jgi:hypothetical protein
VLVNDGIGTTTDACEPILNFMQVAGNIALIDRGGSCSFVAKAQAAQTAGATAVIIANNAPGLVQMSGTASGLTIPVIGISLADGNTIKANLPATANVGSYASQLAGADANGHVQMYAPDPFESGSSISHWDPGVTPNALMEPFINADLTQDVDLTRPAFQDIGWFAGEDEGANPGIHLESSAPNPFANTTTFSYALDQAGIANVGIFDLNGRRLITLFDGPQTAGPHTATWDGHDEDGRQMPPGLYFYRLRVGGSHLGKRIALIP